MKNFLLLLTGLLVAPLLSQGNVADVFGDLEEIYEPEYKCYQSKWFGYFRALEYPWILSYDLGWLYIAEATSETGKITVWSPSHGWLYLTEEQYPRIYFYDHPNPVSGEIKDAWIEVNVFSGPQMEAVLTDSFGNRNLVMLRREYVDLLREVLRGSENVPESLRETELKFNSSSNGGHGIVSRTIRINGSGAFQKFDTNFSRDRNIEYVYNKVEEYFFPVRTFIPGNSFWFNEPILIFPYQVDGQWFIRELNVLTGIVTEEPFPT